MNIKAAVATTFIILIEVMLGFLLGPLVYPYQVAGLLLILCTGMVIMIVYSFFADVVFGKG